MEKQPGTPRRTNQAMSSTIGKIPHMIAQPSEAVKP